MKRSFALFTITALIVGIFMVSGCAKKAVKPEKAPEKTEKPITEQKVPEETIGGGTPVEEGAIEATGVDEAAAAVSEETVAEIKDVFFDYDRYNIREDARAILEENAQVLLNGKKDARVVIEGHCDERGTVEYNIALGQRRADAVKKYLVNLGVDPSRITTVSYGKERPFCLEHNEQCWQKNRRAHFVIK